MLIAGFFHSFGPIFLDFSPQRVMYSGWVGDNDPNFGGLEDALKSYLQSAWASKSSSVCVGTHMTLYIVSGHLQPACVHKLKSLSFVSKHVCAVVVLWLILAEHLYCIKSINITISLCKDYANFGSDIGGYRTGPGTLGRTKELLIRWAQLGAFSPLMENGGNKEHRPWKFDTTNQTLNIYRK